MMEKEFKHILDQHNRILYKIGRSYTSGKADFEDLHQEMLIQLWQSYPRFRGDAKLSTWLYRVALNTALTFTRKQKRSIWTLSLEEAGTFVDPSSDEKAAQEEVDEQVEALYRSIQKLDKNDRAIILLHLEGKSYEEMAEIIGISKSNLGVRLMRAKKKLAIHIGEKKHDHV